jgi:predicted lipoprotein with Yx(FWY)xxD motif
MRNFTGFVAVVSLAVASSALAAPAGVTEKAGAFVAPDGKPLYTFARDTVPGKSACNGPCATAWPPLAASPDARDDGDWTVVTRDDGSRQWAYKTKPLYSFAKDASGGAATGVSANWPLATK